MASKVAALLLLGLICFEFAAGKRKQDSEPYFDTEDENIFAVFRLMNPNVGLSSCSSDGSGLLPESYE